MTDNEQDMNITEIADLVEKLKKENVFLRKKFLVYREQLQGEKAEELNQKQKEIERLNSEWIKAKEAIQDGNQIILEQKQTINTLQVKLAEKPDITPVSLPPDVQQLEESLKQSRDINDAVLNLLKEAREEIKQLKDEKQRLSDEFEHYKTQHKAQMEIILSANETTSKAQEVLWNEAASLQAENKNLRDKLTKVEGLFKQFKGGHYNSPVHF